MTYREPDRPPCPCCTRPNVNPLAARWGRGWRGVFMYPCRACGQEHGFFYWGFSRLGDDLAWGWRELVRPLFR